MNTQIKRKESQKLWYQPYSSINCIEYGLWPKITDVKMQENHLDVLDCCETNEFQDLEANLQNKTTKKL